MMGKIKGRNTKPEMVVRSLCHAMGLRFRLHRKDLPGSPDLVFPKYRLCLFVHGCFWHRHPGCKYAYTPKTRLDFWLPKLQRNMERDQEKEEALRALGWRVEVVWECETKSDETLHEKILKIFKPQAGSQ
ncbi:DNA mismatch endonuclease (patch repair protein) [Pseudomonas citronellolis]|nr:DNA mismatch endonuclease (patch repair protein) [Pseudomonas citronellolis]MCP1664946.1 DNA mismatch endonuclease (patch repair protein) [Pseudomonas citronellolis]MCP1695595.1 DNA mismatch endonuclease (patch repair protein) [Pseudomonas citronellolis]MCP1702782.1 DNA mismatch endonuclease (patch repair protein) [Pseudomonas citronellolis]MCP1796742.1 DNA mismatch endonuclease (patch repair protein) [Pseudomonas citronellolis]